MIPITIHKPVWHNRTISIRKDLIELAQRKNEAIQVKIEAKPYINFTYIIDPSKALSIGKSWIIKGMELINFPIKELTIVNQTIIN